LLWLPGLLPLQRDLAISSSSRGLYVVFCDY
jgi:hypothetical protein